MALAPVPVDASLLYPRCAVLVARFNVEVVASDATTAEALLARSTRLLEGRPVEQFGLSFMGPSTTPTGGRLAMAVRSLAVPGGQPMIQGDALGGGWTLVVRSPAVVQWLPPRSCHTRHSQRLHATPCCRQPPRATTDTSRIETRE